MHIYSTEEWVSREKAGYYRSWMPLSHKFYYVFLDTDKTNVNHRFCWTALRNTGTIRTSTSPAHVISLSGSSLSPHSVTVLPVVTHIRAQEPGRVIIVAALLAALLTAAIQGGKQKQLHLLKSLWNTLVETQNKKRFILRIWGCKEKVSSYLIYNRHEWFEAS